MLYFLINNNYHLSDINLLLQDTSVNCSLIEVPHTLDNSISRDKFKHVYTFNYFYTGWRSLFEFRKIFSTLNDIRKQLSAINKDDVLYVYTDYEILNQYVIALFKKEGAKVYLLEDGFASVTVYNFEQLRLPFSQAIQKFILSSVYGFTYLNILTHNESYYPVIKDNYIDGIFLYLKAKINRNIPILYIKNNTSPINDLKKGVAIFLNQDLYAHYQSYKCYIADLIDIFKSTANNFNHIYFKFHPRETEETKADIKAKLVSFSNVEFIDRNFSIEETVLKLKPKHAISFYSSALKDLFFYGLEPIFLFHLLKSISHNEVSVELQKYLSDLGYHFPQSMSEIDSNYKSNLQILASAASPKDIFKA